MHILSYLIDIILTGYITWEVVRFPASYRQLKQAIVDGDPQARTRVYRRAIVFEWVSALLSLAALGFDWSKLNPKLLALDGLRMIQMAPHSANFDRGAMAGLFVGVAMGTIGFIIVRLKANRRGATAAANAPVGGLRRLIPDFSAMIPVTTNERLLWTVVAISAGICEEIVFRGWLLATLHAPLLLAGTALVVAASVIFGLAHSYQGITGMLLTAFAGAFFCGLYVATGSLLMPILLHIVIDARFAILPGPRVQAPRVAYT
jgi:membrane protease YdiL (CAAX protease family)